MSTLYPTPVKEKTMLIDEVGTITYIGVAKLGVATSDAQWQIRKIQLDGTTTSLQYANGSRRYNQVWDDRSILTYSN